MVEKTFQIAADQSLRRDGFFLPNRYYDWNSCVFLKKRKVKRNFSGNLGQNICRSFNVLTKVCLHYKQNGARSLSPESDYMSCLTDCRTTHDLGS